MSSNRQIEGHVLVPVLAIGSLALVLAAGFGTLGFMDRADEVIGEALKSGGLSETTRTLPDWVIWMATAIGAFGLSAAILGVPGNWRRGVLLVSALVVMAGWAPVLILASYAPNVAMPLLGTFWAGLCAFVYASRHHMPVDD